jgi:hypothetical protein
MKDRLEEQGTRREEKERIIAFVLEPQTSNL